MTDLCPLSDLPAGWCACTKCHPAGQAAPTIDLHIPHRATPRPAQPRPEPRRTPPPHRPAPPTPVDSTAALAEQIRDHLADITNAWTAWKPTLRAAPTARATPSSGTLPATQLAAWVRRDATDSIAAWTDWVLGEHAPDTPAPNPFDVPAMCALLAAHADWLSGTDQGATLPTRARAIANNLHALTPKGRTHRVILGPCPDCTTPITCLPHDETATCPGCGHHDTLTHWQHTLLGAAPLLTLGGVRRYLHQRAGITYTRQHLHALAKRGTITPTGWAVTPTGTIVRAYDPRRVIQRLIITDTPTRNA